MLKRCARTGRGEPAEGLGGAGAMWGTQGAPFQRPWLSVDFGLQDHGGTVGRGPRSPFGVAGLTPEIQLYD